jgi:hypothetical protein
VQHGSRTILIFSAHLAQTWRSGGGGDGGDGGDDDSGDDDGDGDGGGGDDGSGGGGGSGGGPPVQPGSPGSESSTMSPQPTHTRGKITSATARRIFREPCESRRPVG